MPGKTIPRFSWLELISFDKFIHASIFFILQVLYMHGFSSQISIPFFKKHFLIIPLIFGIVYGGSLELMQNKVFSDRSGDPGDFIANTFGSVVGAMAFSSIRQTGDKILRYFSTKN